MTACLRSTLLVLLALFITCSKIQFSFGRPRPTESTCIFDEVQSHVVHKSSVRYQTARSRRSVEGLYQPIRMNISVHYPNNIVDLTDVRRLEFIINQAVSIIRRIISVAPVEGPLLMQRSATACQPRYTSGVNFGKCVAVTPDYAGEECLDNFLIPNDHLEGLWTWDATNPEPAHEVYANGPGLPNTDIVLYTKTEHTNQCNTRKIVAYAASCMLDQNDRPIAGVINFCPAHLKDDLFDQQKFILLAVHEIFHILGFSSSLFDKFKDCSMTADRVDCVNRCTATTTDSQGVPRLVTPTVTAHAQKHFGCDQSGFGGPLEARGGDGFSSHWETRMMYGSIMAPVVNQPHQTFLDSLTLAVFEDTGWYRVNYEYAEAMPWGKDQGCEFGLKSTCRTSPSEFFCNDSSSGCHYLHEDTATCSTNEYLEGCRIMDANRQGHCSTAGEGSPSDEGEVFDENSRCFLSNVSSTEVREMTGSCYLSRCDNQSLSYDVKVGSAEWQPCRDDAVIEIPGFLGYMHCPPVETICRQRASIIDLIDSSCSVCLSTSLGPSKISTEPPNDPTQASDRKLCISVEFAEIDYSALAQENQQHVFREAVIKGVCDVTKEPESRISVTDVAPGITSAQEMSLVLVTFDILQAGSSSDTPAHQVYISLRNAVASHQLKVEYMDVNYTAVRIRLLDGDLPTSPQSDGTTTMPLTIAPFTIILSACLALLAVVLALVFIFYKLKPSNEVNPSIGDARDNAAIEERTGVAYKDNDKL